MTKQVNYILKKNDERYPYLKEYGRSDTFVSNIANAYKFSLEEVIKIVGKNKDKWTVIMESVSYEEVTINISVEPVNQLIKSVE